MRNELNILIGGEAGQGLVTVGGLLARALVRAGYHVHVTQNYMSRIRGGHNTFSVRAGVDRVLGPVRGIDILMALNKETIELHSEELNDSALIIKDKDTGAEEGLYLAVPFRELAGERLYENVVGLGILSALVGLDESKPRGCIETVFGRKKKELVGKNLEVLKSAYTYAEEKKIDEYHLVKSRKKPGLMLTGSDGVALGAMAAGVSFCSFYPMTPSTGIPLSLKANAEEMGIVVEQAEDEIACINMALGASYAGARSMTATSGGGFALMSEGVSLAGMTETPVVIVVGQRPGPATGLPTRTEQGDINLVLYAGHGEFPRAIFAPADPEQCFYLTHKAFNLAEKSQGPVFILTDQYLADSYRSSPFPNLAVIDEKMVRPGDTWDNPDEYERYAITDDGCSPRLVPTLGPYLVVVDSDEHTPDGHITEDFNVRREMVDKRLRKTRVLEKETVRPGYFGPDKPKTLLVCWGSTLGPALEAAEKLDPKKTSVLHFSQIWPLNKEHFEDYFSAPERVVFVESNATGQFRALVEKENRINGAVSLLRYDGLPMDAEYIVAKLD